MGAADIGMLAGTAIGTVGMQLAVRFALLRFMQRKSASLVAGVLAIAAAFYAGDAALVAVPAAAITLLAQMAREPAKEAS